MKPFFVPSTSRVPSLPWRNLPLPRTFLGGSASVLALSLVFVGCATSSGMGAHETSSEARVQPTAESTTSSSSAMAGKELASSSEKVAVGVDGGVIRQRAAADRRREGDDFFLDEVSPEPTSLKIEGPDQLKGMGVTNGAASHGGQVSVAPRVQKKGVQLSAMPQVSLSPSDRFAAGQDGFRQGTPKGGMICPAAVTAWSDFLGVADEAMKGPVLQLSPLNLTEIATTLAREMGLCEAYYAPLPPWLAVAVQARVLAIEGKLKERRTAQEQLASGKGGKRRVKSPKQVASAWQWPILHPTVTSNFGIRDDPFTNKKRMHNGVDIRSKNEERVEAIGPGIVTRAGVNGGHGISVEVLHEGGFTSVYSHLSLALLIPGDQVAKGDAVGISGNTGRSTGPHLHFELWLNDRPVNPLKFLKDTPEFGCEEGTTEEGFWKLCGTPENKMN